MAAPSIFEQILDPANRPNPYPLYAKLRNTPVTREADGTYVVSTYNEIVALLHDPRVSSDPRSRSEIGGGVPPLGEGPPGMPPPFLDVDPPDHDRLRTLATRPFGPPHTPERVEGMRGWLAEVTNRLIDNIADANQVDIVDDFAYPLPVTAICRLLGVPPEDEPRFHQWADVARRDARPDHGIIRTAQPWADRGQRRTGPVPGRARRCLRPPARRRPDLRDAHRHRPGRPDVARRTVDHRRVAARRWPRDHGQPHHQRHADPAASPRRARAVAPRRGPDRPPGRGAAALRTTGASAGQPHGPGGHRGRRHHHPRRAPQSSWCSPPATATPTDSPTRTASIRTAPTTNILASAAASTTASAPPLPAWRHRLPCPHWSAGSQNPRLVTDPPPYRPNPALRGPRHLLVEIDGVGPAVGAMVDAG